MITAIGSSSLARWGRWLCRLPHGGLRLRTHETTPQRRGIAPLWERSHYLRNYHVKRLKGAHLWFVGAGANSYPALALARKGVGAITICDGDHVEPSNLPRQWYLGRQQGGNKALGLARNLAAWAIADSVITAYPLTFQQVVELGLPIDPTIVVCVVDNDFARIAVARYCLARAIPVIFGAFNAQAEGGYVFVQTSTPGEPCFGCLFPGAVRDPRGQRCDVGATIDPVMMLAGLIGWAVDCLVGNRSLTWRLHEFSLAGDDNRLGPRPVPVRPNCPICSAAAPIESR